MNKERLKEVLRDFNPDAQEDIIGILGELRRRTGLTGERGVRRGIMLDVNYRTRAALQFMGYGKPLIY